MKTGYSGWLDVSVSGPLRPNLVFGLSIGQAKQKATEGKLSQPNSASTLVRRDMIMGRNQAYPPTHHQEFLRHFQET